MDQSKIAQLQKMVDESERIVFFGGAGVSTESGIPDFRSVDGLYNQKYDYPPEQILSHTFFMRNRPEFYRFYYDKILVDGVEPNAAHKALARLEEIGKLTAIVTQNIDGLHQKAGSKNVLEVHGTTLNNICMSCGKTFDIDYMMEQKAKKIFEPACDACGGVIKPDVVLYEEGLDQGILSEAVRQISRADMLIVGGTSLVVYPAAGLVDYYTGHRLVLINKSSTAKDAKADLVISDSIGEVLSQLTYNGKKLLD